MEEPRTELVERAQRGDVEAFESLVRGHFDAAFTVALGVTGIREDAEDACQEGLVRAWERLDQCRSPERFRAWFLQVVRSVALNRVARGRGRTMVALDRSLASTGPGPERGAHRRELRTLLDAALQELTGAQRQVLLLYDLEGYRHAEIADILGTSEAMSRRHLSDARARLRQILPGWLVDDDGGVHG